MAALSTAATASTTTTSSQIRQKLSQSQKPPLSFPTSLSLTPLRRRRCACSFGNNSNSSEVSTEGASSTELESEKALDEAPKGPPSLISALNVERALRGIAITDVDHYGRLGLQRGCSYDQVTAAYRSKVEELRSMGLDAEELEAKMEPLKESYGILSSAEERRMYNWSLSRSEMPERYVWPFQVDITETPAQDPPPQEPEDVGPTRAVGYFLLGWFILSAILSIALNR